MTKHITAKAERQQVYTLSALALLLVLFAAYIYFLSFSVVHVVMRKEIRSEISALNSEVAMLEAEYIKEQHAVSKDVASQQGYVAVAEKVFLSRSDTNLAMSAR